MRGGGGNNRFACRLLGEMLHQSPAVTEIERRQNQESAANRKFPNVMYFFFLLSSFLFFFILRHFLQCLHERMQVAELAVDGGEADISDLIEGL